MMNRIFLIFQLALLTILCPSIVAQDIKTIKKTATLICDDGISDKSLNYYTFTNTSKWLLTANGKSGKDLKYLGGELPVANQHSPQEMMLLTSNESIGNFLIEFDFFQKGRDFSLRDVCVVYGLQNDSTYFYAQAASEAGRYSHNIFKVSDNQTRKIGNNLTPSVIWNYEKWHHISCVRQGQDVKLWIDNTLILETNADEQIPGKLGIGTYGSEFKTDNIKVWLIK